MNGRVAYIELSGDGGTAYVLEQETGRLLQELSIEAGEGLEGFRLPEGVEEAVVSLPLSSLGIRAMDLPLEDPERVREVLPFELEGLILKDPSEVVLDAVVLDDLGDKRRVLAVYIEKDRLAPLLEGLAGAGIDPRAVTSSELGALVEKLKEGEGLARLIDEGAGLDESERLDRARIEASGPTVNFRRGEFEYTRETARTLRMLIKTAVLAGVLLAALSAHLFLKAADLRKEAGALEGRTLALYSEIFSGEKPASTKGLVYKAEAKIKALREKAALYAEAETLGLLMDLQKTARPEIKLIEITVDRSAVTLSGNAGGLEDVDKLKTALQEFLNDVSITESGAAAAGGIGFTIKARRGEG
jgi:type II secretory pathway component PulL